jgi:hypothetical protein
MPDPKKDEKKKDNYQDAERIPPKAADSLLLHEGLADSMEPFNNSIDMQTSEILDFSQGTDSD